MRSVVIVDSLRLAVGKLGGTLGNVTVDKLGEKVIRGLVERTNLNTDLLDEVIFGQAKQSSDVSNLARVASLRAGLPIKVPAYTIHRQCGSGIEAVNSAAKQLISGYGDVIIAGGAESMSTAPYYVSGVRFGVKAGNIEMRDPNIASQQGSQPIEEYGSLNMGTTAENVAKEYIITREEQDRFALRSQVNMKNAMDNGYFDKEILPYTVKIGKELVEFKKDEHPRETSLEKLGKLKPVFKEGGTVTAGNASGRNDGAAALLIMSEEKALSLGYKPKARIIAQASVGVSPEVMGIAPVFAVRKALSQTDLKIDDLDVVELNEAFAAQAEA